MGVGRGLDGSVVAVAVAVAAVAVAVGAATESHSHSWRRAHCALGEDEEEVGEQTTSSRLAGPEHGPAEPKSHSLAVLVEAEEGLEAAGVAEA